MKFVIVLLTFQTFVHASFLQRASGNTSPQLEKGVGGTINFAVLDRYHGVALDSWGSGFQEFEKAFVPAQFMGFNSPSLDTRGGYLYLYQVINNGLNKVNIQMSSVDLLTDNPQSLATSWGYFSRLGFADDDKNTGKLVPCSVANVFGWMAAFPNTSPAPANLGVNHPGVVDISAEPDRGKNPDLITFRIRQSPVKGTYSELYLEWRGDNVLKPGERSAIYGFTSDYPPTFKDVNVGGGGNPPNPIWIQ